MRPNLWGLIAACLVAAPAGAQVVPLDVDDPTPRAILVQFEESLDLSVVGESFGPAWPGTWSVSGNIGRIDITAETHEQIRDTAFLPSVPGTFSPIVVEIDLTMLEATSQPTGGASSNGTQGASFSTRALDTTALAGFIGPDTGPLFCTSQQQVDDLCAFIPLFCGKVCTIVPGSAYDEASGKINLVGSVEEQSCDGAVCSGPFELFAGTGDMRLLENSAPGVPAASPFARWALAFLLTASTLAVMRREWPKGGRAHSASASITRQPPRA